MVTDIVLVGAVFENVHQAITTHSVLVKDLQKPALVANSIVIAKNVVSIVVVEATIGIIDTVDVNKEPGRIYVPFWKERGLSFCLLLKHHLSHISSLLFAPVIQIKKPLSIFL